MSNKNQKKEIPTKNYFVLGIIVLITVLFFVYLFSWLEQYNDSKINTPIITSTLREVEYNNLNTVLAERDMLIMYMCTTDESICRSFEKKFELSTSTILESLNIKSVGYSYIFLTKSGLLYLL